MNGEKGFTLIELLIVVAIVGVLATIAIYQFAGYKTQAHCASVASDVKNTVVAEEAYYAENQTYGASVVKTGSNNITSNASTPLVVTGDNATNCPGQTFTFNGSTGTYSW